MKIPASAIHAALPATSNVLYLSPLAAVLTEDANMNSNIWRIAWFFATADPEAMAVIRNAK
jgi:hypothetical protein